MVHAVRLLVFSNGCVAGTHNWQIKEIIEVTYGKGNLERLCYSRTGASNRNVGRVPFCILVSTINTHGKWQFVITRARAMLLHGVLAFIFSNVQTF